MRNYFLLFVLVLAMGVRFWQLGNNPVSLTWDEVAWGYNAYSLGIDGRDEFGMFLPLQYLESFGDFKPPVYAYLSIIPVKLFGLNEFSTRFASAFFGLLSVFFTYLLVREIFFQYKKKEELAILSSFLLAISPWHINLSRAAFEANVSSFFIIVGIWAYLKAVNKNAYFFVVSVLSLCVSLYTFNSARVVAPLLFVFLLVMTYKKVFEKKKQMVIACMVGFICIVPLIPFLFSPAASLRFREVNIFSDPSVVIRSNEMNDQNGNVWWSKVIHNRRLGYAVDYIKHYLDHFTPSFLFFTGDGNPKFSTQVVGQMYLWESIFLIIGVIMLFKEKRHYWWIIPATIIIGILPAGVARETPHALRIETILPMPQILVAYGFYFLYTKISEVYKRNHYKIFFILGLSCIIGFSFFSYFLDYFTYYPKNYAHEWQYGYKDMVLYLKNNKEKYNKIIITEDLGRPYIYTLFYLQYSPLRFRQEARISREAAGFVHVHAFNKFEFSSERDIKIVNDSTLIIDRSEKVPSNGKIVKDFYLLNGDKVLTAYTL